MVRCGSAEQEESAVDWEEAAGFVDAARGVEFAFASFVSSSPARRVKLVLFQDHR
jgi:hypothetical protein